MPQPDGAEEALRATTLTRTETGERRAETILVPGLTVLAHPDLRRVGARVALPALASARSVPLSRLEPTFVPPGNGPAEPLGEPHLSRTPLTLAPGEEPGAIRLVRGESRTAVLADGTPVAGQRAFTAADLDRGVVLLLAGQVALLLHRMTPEPVRDLQRFGLVGDGAAMTQLRREIRQVADLAVPVLLRGETGTGKELVARAFHDAGPRRSGPYVAVNLSAVPAALAASELFGAVRGAFTGADRPRDGYFLRAQGGTLFLDEIGEAPPEVQVQLLRALESGEVQPVGADRPRKVDVRVVAATDADLEAAIAQGRFRGPLLHRLAGCVLHLPPLRRRREDLGQLLIHFLRRELAEVGEAHRLEGPAPGGGSWLPASLVARLAALDWPGNVRQLRNLARQLALGSRGSPHAVLTPQMERLLAEASALPSPPESPAGATIPRSRTAYRPAAEVTEDELLAALRAHRWRLTPTAARLGVSRTALYTLIDRSPRIRKAADLPAGEICECLARHAGDLDAAAEELQVSRHGLQLRRTELGLD